MLVQNKFDTAMAIMARVVTEMSCGEALEFQYAHELAVTEAQYDELIRAKTGSLIGAATEIGAGLNGGRLRSRSALALPRCSARRWAWRSRSSTT
mgnify:CR=1 FL=1